MRIVIFAGGTGKRFWPVSRAKSPKQFLPIAGNKPLLRERVDLLLKQYTPDQIFVSSGKRYAAELMQMLPDLPAQNLILEPEMRDTGPAVTLAVSYVNHLYPGEPVAIQWSDHLIKNSSNFLAALNIGEQQVLSNNAQVCFLAVPARYASPHRGYIKFGNELNKSTEYRLLNFDSFVEKPDLETAQKYIDAGDYAWNPGYWIVNPQYYLNTVNSRQPQMVQVTEKMVNSGMELGLEDFAKLEKISADYIFAEHVKPENAQVILSDLGWSDVGEWVSLKEALQESEAAIVTQGEVKDLSSTDSIIYNTESGKLVATIGLDQMVVVNTPDVVAVFPKSKNAELKKLLNDLEGEGLEEFL